MPTPPSLSVRPLRRLSVSVGVVCAAFAAVPGCGSAQRLQPVAPVADRGSSEAALEASRGMRRFGYRLAWRAPARMTSGAGVAHAGLLGSGFAVQDSAGRVSLLAPLTGQLRWTAAVGGPSDLFLGLAWHSAGVLCCTDTELHVLDAATGDLRDRHKLSLVASTPPLVLGDTVVFGSHVGRVFGHSMKTRYTSWAYQLNGAITAPLVGAGPYAVAVSQSGDVISLRPEDGSSVGRASIFGGIANAPVADGTDVYIAGLDQSVYALNAQDGERYWRRRGQSPIAAQPFVDGNLLCVAVPGEGLVGVSAYEGNDLWTNAEISGNGVAMSADGASVLVWDGAVVRAVGAGDGVVRSSVRLPGVERIVHDTATGGLYTVDSDGVVARYDRRP